MKTRGPERRLKTRFCFVRRIKNFNNQSKKKKKEGKTRVGGGECRAGT
jgi:hypothetical protein